MTAYFDTHTLCICQSLLTFVSLFKKRKTQTTISILQHNFETHRKALFKIDQTNKSIVVRTCTCMFYLVRFVSLFKRRKGQTIISILQHNFETQQNPLLKIDQTNKFMVVRTCTYTCMFY